MISIVLVDDHMIMLDGMKSLIEKVSDMKVVGVATDGREALKLVAELEPEIVVMDINMPNLNGIDATSQLTSQFPATKVLALSVHEDPQFIERMLQSGAKGYLIKDCAYEELIRAIRAIYQGKAYLSPEVTESFIDGYLSPRKRTQKSILSVREREVLQLLSEGKSTKEAAAILYISSKTVERHRKNMMEKLGTDNLADLIKYALREGITSL